MTRMGILPLPRHSGWLAALAVVLAVADARGQVTRLANDEPEIRLRSGGRSGVCDVLRFTPDVLRRPGDGTARLAHVVELMADERIRRDLDLHPVRQPAA